MKKKLMYVLLICTLALGSFTLFRVATANTPEVISDIFPDPVLAELVAVNLNLEVSDRVVDAELLDVFVLNLSPDERVEDFTGIERLQNLEHLYASYHGLTSLEPFASLTNLRVLDVEGNYISDLGPLAGLVSLEDVRLGWNPLDCIEALAGIPGIRSLTLFQTDVRDLSAVSGMSQLEKLDLSSFVGSASELSALSGLVSLRTLILRNAYLNDISFLSGLTGLEKLILEHNLYIDDLTPLSSLSGLRHLEVVNNLVHDLTPLAGLQNLEFLSLMGNQIEDVSLLASLSHLEDVNLLGNWITDVEPLLGMSGVLMDVSEQWVMLPYIEIGVEQPFVVYGLHGEALPLVLADGYGMYEEGVIVWHDAGFSEFAWSSAEGGVVFSGSVMQYAWQEWDDYTVYENEPYEDLHEDTREWVDCPYEECVIYDEWDWDDDDEIVELETLYADDLEIEDDDNEIRELESEYTEDGNTGRLPQTGYDVISFVGISGVLMLIGIGIGVLKFFFQKKKAVN